VVGVRNVTGGSIKNVLTVTGNARKGQSNAFTGLAKDWSAFYDVLVRLSMDLQVYGGPDDNLHSAYLGQETTLAVFTKNGEHEFELRTEWKNALVNCNQTSAGQALQKYLGQFCDSLSSVSETLQSKAAEIRARYRFLRTGVGVNHDLSKEPPDMVYGADDILTKDQVESVLSIFPDPDFDEG
jgi:hypothetical protein